MDFEDLLSEPQIKEFLRDFPEQEWKSMIKKILIYGISSYKSLIAVGLASVKPVPGLKLKGDEHKEQSCKSKDSKRFNTPNRSTSHSNFHKRCSGSHSCRHTSQNKSTAKSFKFDKALPAKKLVGKEILPKAKNSVGSLGFQTHIFMVDESVGANSISKNLKSEEDSKKQSVPEVIKTGDRVIPKLLKPVELKQIKNHNFSSISAQVFCSSSEVSD